VRLILHRGAVLRGDTELAAYFAPAGQKDWFRALLLIDGACNVSIEGEGVIDGAAARDPHGEENLRGPHTILWNNASGCSISGVSIHDSGNYAMLALGTHGLRISGVTVTGGWDGIHARRCRDVEVTACRFHTGDDSIAGGDLDNASFTHCLLNSSCNGVRIIGPCRHLSVCDCEITGPSQHPHVTQSRHNTLAALLYQPGAWGQAPGESDDILFARLKVRNVQTVLHVGARPGCPIGRLVAEDIDATDVYGPASSIEGWHKSPVRDAVLRRFRAQHTLALSDPSFNQFTRSHHLQTAAAWTELQLGPRPLPAWALYARNVAQLTLEDVEFHRPAPCDQPALRLESCPNLIAEKLTATCK